MRSQGFSLIEVMIVGAIVAVLAAIAYPAYTNSVQKTRRTEGTAALLAIAAQMERYSTERGTYATAALGTGGVFANHTENSYYNLSFAGKTTTTYTVQAVPAGAQAGDPCGTFTYTDSGVKGVNGGTWAVDQCWSR